MTNPPGGMPDMQALMQQAQTLIAAQQELAEATVDGTAGGGLVQATVTGGGELVGLTIDKQVIDPADPETLADLVIAAVRDANGKAQALAADRMGPLTGGLGGLGGGLGLPGLG